MLRHGLITAVFSCLIAAALSVPGGDRGRRSWCTRCRSASSAGSFIDIGRLLAYPAPRGPLAAGGCGVRWSSRRRRAGFLGGNADRRRLGRHAGCCDFLALRRPHSWPRRSIVTLAATVGLCLFFYSRGRSKYLQGEIAQAQRDATEARLKLLETQLEPHMLFNTLANLRVLIALDPPRAAAMLDRLIATCARRSAPRARRRIRCRPSSTGCATTWR